MAGITSFFQVTPGERDYEMCRNVVTELTNAVSESILASGHSVTVVDAHDGNRNILLPFLNADVQLISGSPKRLSMVEGVRDAQAVFFLGYHSMAGTLRGVLEHTYSSKVVHRLMYNGRDMGEIGINAAVAGYFNVPVKFVAGDHAATVEAGSLLKDAILVDLKQGLSRYSALNRSYGECLADLKYASKRALEKNVMPYRIDGPIDVTVEFKSSGMADSCEILYDVERINGYTVNVSATDAVDAYRKFRLLVTLASSE